MDRNFSRTTVEEVKMQPISLAHKMDLGSRPDVSVLCPSNGGIHFIFHGLFRGFSGWQVINCIQVTTLEAELHSLQVFSFTRSNQKASKCMTMQSMYSGSMHRYKYTV